MHAINHNKHLNTLFETDLSFGSNPLSTNNTVSFQNSSVRQRFYYLSSLWFSVVAVSYAELLLLYNCSFGIIFSRSKINEYPS